MTATGTIKMQVFIVIVSHQIEFPELLTSELRNISVIA